MNQDGKRKPLSRLGMCWICLFLLSPLAWGVSPVLSQEMENPTLQITLAELGYGEKALTSPYSTVDYTLRLPEGWKLRPESFFELDVSYTYRHADVLETSVLPSSFGNLIVALDGQTQQVFSIEDPAQEHARLRVELPPSLFDDPARRVYNIKVTLDAHDICAIPHEARLMIHPTSLFFFSYEQLPIVTDLALYPRPFYQQAFEPDQVRFVLPARPAEAEMAGAVAVSSRLGALTYRMVVGGITDLALLDRVEKLGEEDSLDEHLIVIGKPESNKVILTLNRLGVLPVPLKERQLNLSNEGPASVLPGDVLTYTLTLTNSTRKTLPSPYLIDALPAHVQVMGCSPSCHELAEGEVSWSLPSLEPGVVLSHTLVVRASDAITGFVLENAVTLLDETTGPLNVATLTTTLSSTPLPETGPRVSVSTDDGYFFLQGERAVPEHYGVVQEIVSPWDQAKAILIVTGLDDEAVHMASRAMSSESRFPGMEGPYALVRAVRLLPSRYPEPQATDITFADLGYGDQLLEGFQAETSYYFRIPFDWHLDDEAALNLYFGHSQNLDYDRSSLNVSFNQGPVAAISLSDQTSLDGELKVELPPSRVRYGESNVISVQAEMHPLDECAYGNMWLLISNVSLLHLSHSEQSPRPLDLNLYPHPFDRRPDLADLLFVLPPEPGTREWEIALRLASAMGGAAGGRNLAPAVVMGDGWSETELAGYHLVAIGRPSRSSLLREINDQLPQPFLPDSDLIEQEIDNVVLRFPPGVSLGYVQLIPSPWNETRAFLAVTGTTDEAVEWAARLLIDQTSALGGNLILVKDDEIDTIDTRKPGSATDLATAMVETGLTVTASVTPTPLPPSSTSTGTTGQQGAPMAGYPAWLIPFVIVAVIALIAILGLAWWQARQRNL